MVNLNVTWLGLFLSWFRSFTCMIQLLFHSLRFQVVQIKQADCKMSTNNVNNYKWKTFHDIFKQLHTQENKAMKQQIVRLQLNEKKLKENQTRLMSLYWKRKPTWKKDLITYNSHLWIMFPFNWLFIIWRRGVRLELDIQGQEGGGILDVHGQGGGGLENLTIFMDVICVSSLNCKHNLPTYM